MGVSLADLFRYPKGGEIQQQNGALLVPITSDADDGSRTLLCPVRDCCFTVKTIHLLRVIFQFFFELFSVEFFVVKFFFVSLKNSHRAGSSGAAATVRTSRRHVTSASFPPFFGTPARCVSGHAARAHTHRYSHSCTHSYTVSAL